MARALFLGFLVLSGFAHAAEPEGMIDITEISREALPGVLELAKERAEAGDDFLIFRLNSYGGEIFAGLDFIAAVEGLKKSSGISVTCVVDSRAFSMAAVMLQSFCDLRLMTKRATILFHNGNTQVQGTAAEIRGELALLDALNLGLASTIADRLEMPLADYQARVATKDWAMSWQEALDLKVVDRIVDPSVLPPSFER